MNFNKKLAVAVSGAVLLMAGQFALADSTTDIVDALVSKGVLTEEEGKLITKGSESKRKADEKANKSRISVGSFIDNATMYGDIRARYERRDGDVLASNGVDWVNSDINRTRFKITFGLKTETKNAYSDFAMSMGDNGRSDNTSLGENATAGSSGDKGTKSTLYVKRAMFGYKITDWLSVEAGRMANPLYMVNAMVFDHDIVFDGLQEKLKYTTAGGTDLFANVGQYIYDGKGVGSTNGGTTTTQRQNMLLAFQGGVATNIGDQSSVKGAIGYYDYTANATSNVVWLPGFGNTATAVANYGVNNLKIVDIPVEMNYFTNGIGVKPYAEYAYNTEGSDRKAAACASNASYCSLANDDSAWLLGLQIGSGKDLKSFAGKKMAKGDWLTNLWYQDVGIYALNQNAVDSDIFDGRLNMKGTSLKAQYNIEDNLAFNFTGAWGSRKNSQYSTGNAPKIDIDSGSKHIDDYTLYQFDVTYKF